VATFVAVTVAFGTTAPEESFKVPVSAPVAAVWANEAGTMMNEQKSNAMQWNATKKMGLRVALSIGMDPPRDDLMNLLNLC
jgi:hypothetical protein